MPYASWLWELHTPTHYCWQWIHTLVCKKSLCYPGSRGQTWLPNIVALLSHQNTIPMFALGPVPMFVLRVPWKTIKCSPRRNLRGLVPAPHDGAVNLSHIRSIPVPTLSSFSWGRFLYMTCWRGIVVSTVMGCAWKYDFSFRVVIISVKMFFFNRLYLVFAHANTWLA